MQAEHSQALRQQQDRMADIKADAQAQLAFSQQQVAHIQEAADKAHVAKRQARQALEEAVTQAQHVQVHVMLES